MELLSADKNHIATRTYTQETGAAWQDKIDYYDGLGRLEQSVLRYSHNNNNMVMYQEYDPQGRTSREWLPVIFPNNGGKFILPDVVKTKATATFYCQFTLLYDVGNQRVTQFPPLLHQRGDSRIMPGFPLIGSMITDM